MKTCFFSSQSFLHIQKLEKKKAKLPKREISKKWLLRAFFHFKRCLGWELGFLFFPDPSFFPIPLQLARRNFCFFLFFLIFIWFFNLGIRGITQKSTRGMKMVGKYSSWLGGGCLRSDPLLSFYWPTWNFGFISGHASGGFSLDRRHVRSYNFYFIVYYHFLGKWFSCDCITSHF